MKARLLTLNVDFKDPAATSAGTIAAALPGIHVALLQEAKNIRLRRFFRGFLRVVQIGDSGARRGAAIITRDGPRVQLKSQGQSFGARPRPGDRMLVRYLTWADVNLDGLTVRFIAAHKPPRYISSVTRTEFDTALHRVIQSSPHPVIVGADTNEKDPAAWARKFGLKWTGIRIDGFAYSPQLDVSPALPYPVGKLHKSNHPAVVSTLDTDRSRAARV